MNGSLTERPCCTEPVEFETQRNTFCERPFLTPRQGVGNAEQSSIIVAGSECILFGRKVDEVIDFLSHMMNKRNWSSQYFCYMLHAVSLKEIISLSMEILLQCITRKFYCLAALCAAARPESQLGALPTAPWRCR